MFGYLGRLVSVCWDGESGTIGAPDGSPPWAADRQRDFGTVGIIEVHISRLLGLEEEVRLTVPPNNLTEYLTMRA